MRLLRFLRFAFTPAAYLHQAYIHDDETPDGCLIVEFYMHGQRYDGRAHMGPLAWWFALWRAAGNPVAKSLDEY